jgi:alpha-ribazole phosphatase
MTKFWLVRHGQTDWNKEGRWQGQADPPLNVTGRSQALVLAKTLGDQHFEAIYSSDLQRAYETARAIAQPHGLPVLIDLRLREINQGAWEGMLGDEIARRYPSEWAARERDPLHFSPPQGESVVEVASRINAAMDDLASAHAHGPVLVVSHGLALAAIICRANGRPLQDAFDLIPENAHPMVIDWSPDGGSV